MKTKVLATIGLLATALTSYAGGLLTNTNQSISYLRVLARNGAIGIDGVYFNPAGVAFLSDGFHLGLGVQNIYQTRTVTTGMTIPALKPLGFEHPFSLNGGDANGAKTFKAKAAVPIFPTIQAAYNKDKWSFQFGFGVVGGGGKATFSDGLGSFERSIAMIPILLASNPDTRTTSPSYSYNAYMSGQQYDFGVQLGAAYKINEHLAVYGGARFNYFYNKYEGHLTDITANIKGTNEKLYPYFDAKEKGLKALAEGIAAKAKAAQSPEKEKLQATADKYTAVAKQLEGYKEKVADKYLDNTQKGWGITAIIGIDYKSGPWNVAAKYEFPTRLNLENQIKVDNTGMFKEGVNTPGDLPAILAIGGQYSGIKNVRLLASFNYYFDKDARMDKDKQKLLSGNTREYMGGVEWDITPAITVSGGVQCTRYGLGDGAYLSDISFVTSSVSYGIGAKFKIMKNASLNVGYFLTDYEHFKKDTKLPMNASNPVEVNVSEDFTRTNKVFGVGLDIDF